MATAPKDETAKTAKEAEQMRIARAAVQIAKAKGLDWKSLPAEQRRELKKEAKQRERAGSSSAA